MDNSFLKIDENLEPIKNYGWTNTIENHYNYTINEYRGTEHKKVLDYCVERIIVEISQFLRYKNDVSKMPTPMNHPQNLSNAGEKSLSFFKPL